MPSEVFNTLIDGIFKAGELAEESIGKENLSNILEKANVGLNFATSFVEENPGEAFIGLAGALAATTIFGPATFVAGAEQFVESAFGQEIAGYIGTTATRLGFRFLSELGLESGAGAAVKADYRSIENILEELRENGQSDLPSLSLSDDTDSDGNGQLVAQVNVGNNAVNTTYDSQLGALQVKTKDFEYENQTSKITSFNEDGERNTYVYSGPDGSGDVEDFFSRNSGYKNFDGQAVTYTSYDPDLLDQDINFYGRSVAGSQIEFSSNNFTYTDSQPPGQHPVNENVDIRNFTNSSSVIQYDFDQSENGSSFFGNTFNGDLIRLENPNAPTIKDVEVLNTNLSGFSQQNIQFAPHAVAINFMGSSIPNTGHGTLSLVVLFA